MPARVMTISIILAVLGTPYLARAGRQNIALPVGGGSLPEEPIAVSLEGADKGSTRS